MKASATLAAFCAGAALFAAGASAAAPIAGLYNTGVNNSGVQLAEGAVDPHYTVNGGGAAYVYTNAAYITTADAKFIALQADGLRPADQDTNTFSLSFDLSGYNASTASISGLFGADNAGTVYLNGVQIATQTDAEIYPNFQSLTSFSANTGFLSGVNTLSFKVHDYNQPTAFVVSALTGSALAAAPEPGTWVLMLGGVGILGAALRLRRAARAAALAAPA